jgi:hypothetical protein
MCDFYTTSLLQTKPKCAYTSERVESAGAKAKAKKINQPEPIVRRAHVCMKFTTYRRGFLDVKNSSYCLSSVIFSRRHSTHMTISLGESGFISLQEQTSKDGNL